ncbi:MAG: hybrid sensor histidine kinase/response regulator [Prosthecobacter sp.]
MQNQYDLKRYAVLYVDDEEKALKYFEKSFSDEFRILTASSAAEGLKLIEQHGDDIGVLLSDQRMPGEKGVQLLERVRQSRPRLVRMMVTAYADYDATVDAVNLGNIFRYVSKPIHMEDMRNTLHRAMEFYILQQEHHDLLREKLSVLQNMLVTDRVLGLGIVAAGLGQNLRQPLRAVHAFLDLTPGRLGQSSFDLDRLRDASFWRDFHGHVVKQAGSIATLLGDLQNGQAGTAGSTVDAATIKAVLASHKDAFTTKGIELVDNVDSALPAIQTDAAAVIKMLELLLQTEGALLSSGAKVTLSAEGIKDGADAGSLRLTLTDSASGLPAATLRSVLDPFATQEDAQATPGLSLLGACFLASHLGGSIRAPRGAQNTRLDITLPATAPAPQSTTDGSREFITNVLMNDILWERLLPNV